MRYEIGKPKTFEPDKQFVMAEGGSKADEMDTFYDPVTYERKTITRLDELKPGDHIRAPCVSKSGTYHHMLVEDSSSDSVRVSHNTGYTDGVQTGQRLRLNPRDVEVLEYKHLPRGAKTYSGHEAIERAHSDRTSGADYSLLSNNCEHYVNRAKMGKSRSTQVETPIEVLNYDDEPSLGSTLIKLGQALWNSK